ncbi:hypothetical protein D3C81_1392800 [compost metagenome]
MDTEYLRRPRFQIRNDVLQPILVIQMGRFQKRPISSGLVFGRDVAGVLLPAEHSLNQCIGLMIGPNVQMNLIDIPVRLEQVIELTRNNIPVVC